MSFDCYLVITGKESGMLYVDCWLGQRGVLEEYGYVTNDQDSKLDSEGLSVYEVTPAQMLEISEVSYAGGQDRNEIEEYTQKYPVNMFHWMFVVKW